jgi:GNAT superfamily N-acetyltransferase
MFKIKEFEKDDIDKVIAFENELRKQEPDTYYWEPNETYRKQLEQSFEDQRFKTSMSFIAVKENKVIGRIDASLISSRSDASCFSAYLDWICVLKSERHHRVAQALLNALIEKCKVEGVGVLIALMANNDEAQRFYKNVENSSMHDTGIWIDIQ